MNFALIELRNESLKSKIFHEDKSFAVTSAYNFRRNIIIIYRYQNQNQQQSTKMAEKIDLSLDEIIKRSKKGGIKKGGSKQQQHKPNLQRLRNLGARSGITRKGGPKQINPRQQASPKKELTMLHVANLDWAVDTNDVKELFSDVGPVKKAVVHYDKSGRSLGTAEVTFLTREAAIRAIKQYHNIPLDGRPMSITLVPNQNSSRSPAKARIGVKPGSGIYKRQPTKGTRGPTNKGRANNTRGNKSGFKQRANKREPKKALTVEELDADLTSYKAHSMNVD